MSVHHARHAIKPETIEHEFLHVETKVRQQEAKNFVMSVVEQTTVL